MANNKKLLKQFTINTDEDTAQRIETIAKHYQRKPAELLRLLLAPVVLNEFIKVTNQEHPENTNTPQLAIFKR